MAIDFTTKIAKVLDYTDGEDYKPVWYTMTVQGGYCEMCGDSTSKIYQCTGFADEDLRIRIGEPLYQCQGCLEYSLANPVEDDAEIVWSDR